MRLSLPPAATGTLLAAVSAACYLNGNTLSDTISLLFATAVVCVLPAIFHLFFMHKRFLLHRLSGFLYLANFTTQCAMELYDFPLLEQYHKYLVVALAGNGCLQAIIAGFTFKFLPNTDGKVQGYYTDKRTMSRDFVLENVFFSGLLFFQMSATDIAYVVQDALKRAENVASRLATPLPPLAVSGEVSASPARPGPVPNHSPAPTAYEPSADGGNSVGGSSIDSNGSLNMRDLVKALGPMINSSVNDALAAAEAERLRKRKQKKRLEAFQQRAGDEGEDAVTPPSEG